MIFSNERDLHSFMVNERGLSDVTAHWGDKVIVLYTDDGNADLDIGTLSEHKHFDTWEEMIHAPVFDGKTLLDILPELDVELD